MTYSCFFQIDTFPFSDPREDAAYHPLETNSTVTNQSRHGSPKYHDTAGRHICAIQNLHQEGPAGEPRFVRNTVKPKDHL